MRREGCLGLLLALAFLGSEARAGHWFHGREGTPPPGHPRYFEHSFARAGNPNCVCSHAIQTNGLAYVGYYVGGGSACHGCGRRPEDGTWGWDYQGLCFPRHVWLSWSHGRREQGGTGSYNTDGPSLHHGGHEHIHHAGQ